jgi:acetyl-CoA acetyltransferase
VQEVIMGVLPAASPGAARRRHAAGIPNATPATTVNKMCGSA